MSEHQPRHWRSVPRYVSNDMENDKDAAMLSGCSS